jgi:hypothetical protein
MLSVWGSPGKSLSKIRVHRKMTERREMEKENLILASYIQPFPLEF